MDLSVDTIVFLAKAEAALIILNYIVIPAAGIKYLFFSRRSWKIED